MASTYSDLKIELIGSGEQAGTWGATTNTNLGTAVGEAITGSADVAFSSADVTLTLTDTNASQAARNLRLNLTGTSGGARNLILGSGCQIDKFYIINNGLSDAVTVKNTTGTGIVVPAGKTKFVFNDGTNVVEALTVSPTVNLASDVTGTLPVANGGTGITSFGTGVATALGGNVDGSGSIVLNDSPTLITPDIGTPSAGNLDNCINLPIATGISGLGSNVATFLATPSSSNLAAAVTDETGSGALVFATSPTLVTPALGTPTSGNLENCTVAGGVDIGFRNIPQSGSSKTTSYTLAVGDVGKFIVVGSGGSITIPDTTFSAGDVVSIFNNTSGDITITCTVTTAYIGGTDADKASVTLSTRGVCNVLFISGTVCVITGNVT